MYQKIYNDIREIIIETNGWINKEAITESASLKDLGIDSIQMMVLVVECEERMGITFGEDVLETDYFNTVEALAKYVCELLEEKNNGTAVDSE